MIILFSALVFLLVLFASFFFIGFKNKNPVEERYDKPVKRSFSFNLKKLWNWSDICPVSFDTIFTIDIFITGLFFACIMFFLNNILISILAAITVFATAPTLIINILVKRKINKFKKKLEFAISIVISSLEVGMPLFKALKESSQFAEEPLKSEFSRMSVEIEGGIPATKAFQGLYERFPCRESSDINDAMELYETVGGAKSVDLLRTLLVNLQETMTVNSQVQQYTKGAKTSVVMMACVPVAFSIIMILVAPDLYSVLWTTTSGKITLAFCIGLFIFGVWVIWSIISNIEEL
ncbi:type II secretion system F family protein [Aceticella autotrophica]|uniref:Type II secretion system F family protein n=1 Tax=Aceticella autotrophica TaxID=2755338 RepID=A0A975AW61_9THEO|nr:type II secretion system F family protein [Aceticella autotrophica]QSZ27592.1 type II secretion system F family protein [Aceticella autotrophica]